VGQLEGEGSSHFDIERVAQSRLVLIRSSAHHDGRSHQFIVAERHAHPDDDSFWRKFSHSDGQRLGYQKILDTLRKERTAIAARHAADARSFFGGDLDHPRAAGAFRYVRSGKSLVCTDDDTVAQRWLKLLQDRHDVAAQWAATRNV